jgi:hypothetical protein
MDRLNAARSGHSDTYTFVYTIHTRNAVSGYKLGNHAPSTWVGIASLTGDNMCNINDIARNKSAL